MVSELAGTLTKEKIDTAALKDAFLNPKGAPAPVKFGTSGHRGQLGTGFCALHAKAIAQAVARLHKERNITGPILVGGAGYGCIVRPSVSWEWFNGHPAGYAGAYAGVFV